jgi:uncharacterized protein
MQTIAQPIQQGQRTAIIDMLRGWALLGVALMNYTDHYFLGLDFKTFKPDTATGILMGFGQIVFAAKSWSMLSFLFGYGFAVLMTNVFNKGINGYAFFTRRMFWLFVLALVNSAFFWGDILKDYALMGMVLLLFYKLSAKAVFYISIALLVICPAISAYINSFHIPGGFDAISPYYSLFQSHNPLKVFAFGWIATYKWEIVSPSYLVTVHLVMLSCFLLGLAAQKINFFNRLAENKKYIKRAFWSTLVFTLLMMALFITSQQLKLTWMKYYQPWNIVTVSHMLFYVSALCWLYVAGKLKAFFRSIQTIGKMTLTNYMTQNLLAVLLFSGFGFGLSFTHRLHFSFYLLLPFIIYVAQVYFSKWWLSHYNYGPIEWMWRQLSYAKRLPIRKTSSVIEEPALADNLAIEPTAVIVAPNAVS